MKFIRFILFPLVPFYYVITSLRNFFYDRGIFKSYTYEVPVICVGNLSTGGTGKTPIIEVLIQLLQSNRQVATLSRGYKRKTKGFLLADSQASADTLGDEPFQFYSKFSDLLVAVDADRKHGIEQLLRLDNIPDVILLDDAYQHRRVKAGLNILLTAYDTPFYKDIVLPTGNLREPRSGSTRADIIIITKCPKTLSEDKKNDIIARLKPEEYQQVFFSTIGYATEVLSNNGVLNLNEVPKFTLVTGIANAKPLVNYLASLGLRFDHIEYPDHYRFKTNDIKMLSEKNLVITTEKDFVRLQNKKELSNSLYYLPISFEIDKLKEFTATIESFTS